MSVRLLHKAFSEQLPLPPRRNSFESRLGATEKRTFRLTLGLLHGYVTCRERSVSHACTRVRGKKPRTPKVQPSSLFSKKNRTWDKSFFFFYFFLRSHLSPADSETRSPDGARAEITWQKSTSTWRRRRYMIYNERRPRVSALEREIVREKVYHAVAPWPFAFLLRTSGL